jgi:hydroxymethylpyrimidine/phosphomethylpyrimidine kinase
MQEFKVILLGYRSYSAVLRQTSTNAPTVRNIDDSASTPYEDQIGGVWSYFDVGQYRYTKAGMFANADKVDVIISENKVNQGADVYIQPVIIDANTLQFEIGTLNAFNGVIKTPTNAKLYLQRIEIRVYN